MLPEDPILLPKIIDHVFLVAVHPASGREYEEAQSVGHSLRLLGEQPLAPTLFRRFANLGRFVAPYGLYPAYAGKALVDLELGIPFGEAVSLAVGGENVLNTYPDVNQYGTDTVGNHYGQFSPFGFNGAYYYTRLNVGWGGQ